MNANTLCAYCIFLDRFRVNILAYRIFKQEIIKLNKLIISVVLVKNNAIDVVRDAADIIGNDFPSSIDEKSKTRETNGGNDKKSDNQTEKLQIKKENYQTNKEGSRMEHRYPCLSTRK